MFLLGDLVSLGLLTRLAVASLLWVLLHLLIRFHPRGIEMVGGIVIFLGFLGWVIHPRLFPPYGPLLLLLGILIHVLGRVLHWLRM
jgi:hypothetical protein